MKFKLIYPRWKKLECQTTFNLPPHGPIVMSAAIPDYVEIDFVDENVEELDFGDPTDLVGISMMLTSQVKRGWSIADEYRKRGIKVIFGGISTMLHAEETMLHADSVFLGETEGKMEKVFEDFKNNQLQPVYDYLNDFPDMELIGPARRDILTREYYYHKGVQMVDLFHASRGCTYNCYPCAVRYLGGVHFRPRPMKKVVEELETIENNRLFIVDNSLANDEEWLKNLFNHMIPFRKKWCSHTIMDKPEILELASRAGAWYVYQAIFDTSDYIRNRIKKYHDHDIAVEGTVLLGLDTQTEDDILRLVDFLLEIDLDLAEFTILTPFPHTRAYNEIMKEGRIIDHDWDNYNAGNVVFQPKNMSHERLQELYSYAWQTFYKEESQSQKMFKLMYKVMTKEMADGTYKTARKDLLDKSFGKKITR